MSNKTEVAVVGDILKFEEDSKFSREEWNIAAAGQGVLELGDITEVSGTDMIAVATAGNAAGILLDKLNPELVAAEQTLLLAEDVTDVDTVIINGKTYTFKDSLSDTDGFVYSGSNNEESIENLIAAINVGVGSGTEYAASTTIHTTVYAKRGPTLQELTIVAKTPGIPGNAFATTETLTHADNVWGAATMAGGIGVLATTGVFLVRHAVVVGDQLNYNGLVVATVNTALKAIGIIVRAEA